MSTLMKTPLTKTRTPAKASGLKRTVGASAVGCALCLGAIAPTVFASSAAGAQVPAAAQAQLDGLLDDGVIENADPYTGEPGQVNWYYRDRQVDNNPDVIMVVTPGTDDSTLYPRIKGLRGDRTTYIVDYPQSLGPFIAGKADVSSPMLAPGYDASREVAVQRNLAVMAALQNTGAVVVYTGYSQGAEALGNAAELAYADDLLTGSTTKKILLISDPRSPWGLKSWAKQHFMVSMAMDAVGAESNGARDPGATGDTDVTSVIIVGDPVANFQWVWFRPVSSLVVDLAGFLTIHSGGGSENYATLNEMDPPTHLYSEDGNTTYLIYRTTHHPLTLLAQMVRTDAGLDTTDEQLERWDTVNNAFYPLQEPLKATADPAAPVVTTPAQRVAQTPHQSDSGTTTSPDIAADTGPAVTAYSEPVVDSPPSPTAPVAGSDHGVTADDAVTPPSTTPAPPPGGRHQLLGGGRHQRSEQPSTGGGRHAAPESGGDPTGGDAPHTDAGGNAVTGDNGTGDNGTGDSATRESGTGGPPSAGGGGAGAAGESSGPGSSGAAAQSD